MAAGEILRHSSTGAGILHRRLENIPANETAVFLRVEILTHLVFFETVSITLREFCFLSIVSLAYTKPKRSRSSFALAVHYIPPNSLLQPQSRWGSVYHSRNGPGPESSLALESELNASKPDSPKWTSEAVSNYQWDILSTFLHGTNAKQTNANNNTKPIVRIIQSQNYQQLQPHRPIHTVYPSSEFLAALQTTCSIKQKQANFRFPSL